MAVNQNIIDQFIPETSITEMEPFHDIASVKQSYNNTDLDYEITTDHPYMRSLGLSVFQLEDLYDFWNRRGGDGKPLNQKYFGIFHDDPKDYKHIPEVVLLGENTAGFGDKTQDAEGNPSVGFHQWRFNPLRMTTGSEKFYRKGHYNKFFYADGDTFGKGELWQWDDSVADEAGQKRYQWKDLEYNTYGQAGNWPREYWHVIAGNYGGGPFSFGDGKGGNQSAPWEGIQVISNLIVMNRYANFLETQSAAEKAKWSKKEGSVVQFIRDIKSSKYRGDACGFVEWSGLVPFHITAPTGIKFSAGGIESNLCKKAQWVKFQLRLYDTAKPNKAKTIVPRNPTFAAHKVNSLGEEYHFSQDGWQTISTSDKDKAVADIRLLYLPRDNKWSAGSRKFFAKADGDIPASRPLTVQQYKELSVEEQLKTEAGDDEAHLWGQGVVVPVVMHNANPTQFASSYELAADFDADNQELIKPGDEVEERNGKKAIKVYNAMERKIPNDAWCIVEEIDNVLFVRSDTTEDPDDIGAVAGIKGEYEFQTFLTHVGHFHRTTRYDVLDPQNLEEYFHAAYYHQNQIINSVGGATDAKKVTIHGKPLTDEDHHLNFFSYPLRSQESRSKSTAQPLYGLNYPAEGGGFPEVRINKQVYTDDVYTAKDLTGLIDQPMNPLKTRGGHIQLTSWDFLGPSAGGSRDTGEEQEHSMASAHPVENEPNQLFVTGPTNEVGNQRGPWFGACFQDGMLQVSSENLPDYVKDGDDRGFDVHGYQNGEGFKYFGSNKGHKEEIINRENKPFLGGQDKLDLRNTANYNQTSWLRQDKDSTLRNGPADILTNASPSGKNGRPLSNLAYIDDMYYEQTVFQGYETNDKSKAGVITKVAKIKEYLNNGRNWLYKHNDEGDHDIYDSALDFKPNNQIIGFAPAKVEMYASFANVDGRFKPEDVNNIWKPGSANGYLGGYQYREKIATRSQYYTETMQPVVSVSAMKRECDHDLKLYGGIKLNDFVSEGLDTPYGNILQGPMFHEKWGLSMNCDLPSPGAKSHNNTSSTPRGIWLVYPFSPMMTLDSVPRSEGLEAPHIGVYKAIRHDYLGYVTGAGAAWVADNNAAVHDDGLIWMYGGLFYPPANQPNYIIDWCSPFRRTSPGNLEDEEGKLVPMKNYNPGSTPQEDTCGLGGIGCTAVAFKAATQGSFDFKTSYQMGGYRWNELNPEGYFDMWGREPQSFTDARNTFGVWTRIFESWPKEQTIFDGRYMAVHHMNSGIFDDKITTENVILDIPNRQTDDEPNRTGSVWFQVDKAQIGIDLRVPCGISPADYPEVGEEDGGDDGQPPWETDPDNYTPRQVDYLPLLANFYGDSAFAPTGVGGGGPDALFSEVEYENWRVDTKRRGKLLPYRYYEYTVSAPVFHAGWDLDSEKIQTALGNGEGFYFAQDDIFKGHNNLNGAKVWTVDEGEPLKVVKQGIDDTISLIIKNPGTYYKIGDTFKLADTTAEDCEFVVTIVSDGSQGPEGKPYPVGTIMGLSTVKSGKGFTYGDLINHGEEVTINTPLGGAMRLVPKKVSGGQTRSDAGSDDFEAYITVGYVMRAPVDMDQAGNEWLDRTGNTYIQGIGKSLKVYLNETRNGLSKIEQSSIDHKPVEVKGATDIGANNYPAGTNNRQEDIENFISEADVNRNVQLAFPAGYKNAAENTYEYDVYMRAQNDITFNWQITDTPGAGFSPYAGVQRPMEFEPFNTINMTANG